MTTQQSFKRRIRSRMEKTGESYTAARAQLLPDPEPDYVPKFSDEVVRRNTGGRGYASCSPRSMSGARPSARTPRSPAG